MFLWEAWQDLTLIILMIAAVASLALGIKTEVSLGRGITFMPSVFAIVLECLGLKLISVTLAVFLARQQLFFVVAPTVM